MARGPWRRQRPNADGVFVLVERAEALTEPTGPRNRRRLRSGIGIVVHRSHCRQKPRANGIRGPSPGIRYAPERPPNCQRPSPPAGLSIAAAPRVRLSQPAKIGPASAAAVQRTSGGLCAGSAQLTSNARRAYYQATCVTNTIECFINRGETNGRTELQRHDQVCQHG